MQDTISILESRILSNIKTYVVAVNVDVIMKIEKDDYLNEIVKKADISLVDGKPLIWISKIYKNPIKHKISGSDLVPALFEASAKKGYSIFIIGGKEGVADIAKIKLENKIEKINIVGTYAPPFGFEQNKLELTKINEMINISKPDILVACFGCPKQEKWVFENYNEYSAKVTICAGATVDFLAENIKRAPSWMSEIGLEWFYRFLQEPKRMFTRYFIDDTKILKLIWKYRKSRV